jgi:hypothetical protein
MLCVGFKTTIPAAQRVKTVHALDLAATVTGSFYIMPIKVRKKNVIL